MSDEETVTLITSEVVWLPAASRARAANVCAPPDAVDAFHVIEYGAVVSSAPYGAPSNRNWTLSTPTLSEALADTVTAVPDTVAPLAGAVIETTGGVVSALFTVTVIAVAVFVLPAASRATAVSVWLPLEAVVVFQVRWNGLAPSSEPRLPPSSLNWTPTTPTLSDAAAETMTLVPDTVTPLAGAVIEIA